MATELKMPQMGYDMEEGTVVRWLKEEGSAVNRNEAVAEIETDKAIVEFESDSEGVLLKIIAPEGTVVPVGQTIAVIGDEGEETDNISILDLRPPEEGKSDPTKNATPPTERQESTPALSVTKEASEVSTGRILSTPIARRMAEGPKIDLYYI